MSNKYKDLRELQKAIFLQKSYRSIKNRLFHLKQSRPELRKRPTSRSYTWTPERYALLIRARLSQEKKTWTQICEEDFPGSTVSSLTQQWNKMREQYPDLLNVVDEAAKFYIRHDETVSSEKEYAMKTGELGSTAKSKGKGRTTK
jgi:hypothetical protein